MELIVSDVATLMRHASKSATYKPALLERARALPSSEYFWSPSRNEIYEWICLERSPSFTSKPDRLYSNAAGEI